MEIETNHIIIGVEISQFNFRIGKQISNLFLD